MNKVLIIDSGMKNLGGHNFSYTRSVQSALNENGFTTDVLANQELLSDIAEVYGYYPTFSQGAYDFPPPGNIKTTLQHLYQQSKIYASELEKFFSNRPSEYAAVFCHTIGEFELIAWNRFLSRNKLNAQLYLLLRTTPNFRQMSIIKKRIHPYFRIKPYYLNQIHKKLKERFTLLTDSESLSEDYAAVFRDRIVTMPIPMNQYFLNNTDFEGSLAEFKNRYGLNKKKGICVGYMGDAREVKGFYLLPKMVLEVLNQRNNVFFLFQCPRSMGGEIPRGVEEMNNIAAEFPERVTLVSERLTEIDYANMFRCLDIVLVPYPSQVYREATSGIFAEAVALGKPTLVTEDSWMSHELAKFGGGLQVKRDNSKDLTDKLLELLQNYGEFSDKSQSYSKQWRNFHNPNTLAKILISEIK